MKYKTMTLTALLFSTLSTNSASLYHQGLHKPSNDQYQGILNLAKYHGLDSEQMKILSDIMLNSMDHGYIDPYNGQRIHHFLQNSVPNGGITEGISHLFATQLLDQFNELTDNEFEPNPSWMQSDF